MCLITSQVLDDNKKLCLMSGEIIQMSAPMNLIFEVQDLAAASPATVSRCGMVYVEPSAMGWRPILQSWLKILPETLTGKWKDQIAKLCEWLLPPCLRCVQKNCKLVMPMQVHCYSQSFLRPSCMVLLSAHSRWLDVCLCKLNQGCEHYCMLAGAQHGAGTSPYLLVSC